jgi:hypothetical protein
MHPSAGAVGSRMLLGISAVAILLSIVLVIALRNAREEHHEEHAAPSVSPVPPREGTAKPQEAIETTTATKNRSALSLEPISSAAKWTLLAKVRDSMGAKAKSFPGLAVEAGVGVPLDPNEPVLARGVTDEHGDVELAFDWSALESARALPDHRLWARVVADGYQQITRTRALPDEPGRGETILLTVPGATLRGRLFDAIDTPIAGRVHARQWTKDGKLGFGTMADVKDDGWFELRTLQGGTFQILAEANDHGTAAASDVVVPSPTPVELHASGPGVVRGRVRDSKGKAVAALEILVITAQLDDETSSSVFPEPLGSRLQMEGRGRVVTNLVTGPDGTFEARGLREDLFVVRARTEDDGPYPLRLTRAPVTSDGTALDLWLDHPRIVVHVVGTDGTPFTALKSDADRENEHGIVPGTPPTRWPEKTDVVVVPGRDKAWPDEDFGRHCVGRDGGAGTMVFNVAPSRSYRVGLIGGNSLWQPVSVDVPFGSGAVEVTLTAASSPLGTLVIRAQNSESAIVRNISIRIEDDVEGTPLLVRKPMFEAESTQSFRLPEGNYRITVQGAPSTEDFHGRMMDGAAFGRYETQVRITSDQRTVVTATLPAGARLRLTVPGEVLEADRKALHDRHPTWNYGGPIDFFAGQVELCLVAEGHWPEPVHFTYELKGSSAAGTHLCDWIPIGKQDTSQLLPAGKYRLEGHMSGGRSGFVDVVLVDGETTDATLDLH